MQLSEKAGGATFLQIRFPLNIHLFFHFESCVTAILFFPFSLFLLAHAVGKILISSYAGLYTIEIHLWALRAAADHWSRKSKNALSVTSSPIFVTP